MRDYVTDTCHPAKFYRDRLGFRFCACVIVRILSWLGYFVRFGCSGLLNASNTSSYHIPTKFSQLPNLCTFITSSPFNVLAVLTLHPSLLLLGHLHHPNWSFLSLCFTLSLESAPFISSSTLFWHQFLHLLLTYSFTHHFFLFWFSTLLIYYSLSLLLPA